MQNNPNQTNQKDPNNGGLDDENTISEQLRTLWCAREDLNLHERNAHQPLKLTRLPIPPLAHGT